MGAAKLCKAKDAGVIIYHIITPAAPTVPCPQKQKNTEMSELISVVLSFWDFCLFAIACFLEVPLVLSFQGKNKKRT